MAPLVGSRCRSALPRDPCPCRANRHQRPNNRARNPPPLSLQCIPPPLSIVKTLRNFFKSSPPAATRTAHRGSDSLAKKVAKIRSSRPAQGRAQSAARGRGDTNKPRISTTTSGGTAENTTVTPTKAKHHTPAPAGHRVKNTDSNNGRGIRPPPLRRQIPPTRSIPPFRRRASNWLFRQFVGLGRGWFL